MEAIGLSDCQASEDLIGTIGRSRLPAVDLRPSKSPSGAVLSDSRILDVEGSEKELANIPVRF
jgi:hypothetical protein